MFLNIFVLLISGTAHFAFAADVESLTADHIRVSVVAPKTFASSGGNIIGVSFDPDPDWHVYWKNPGDSGAAPKFNLSGDAALTEILWPAPVRIPVGELTNLGYDGQVVIPLELKVEPKSKAQISIKLEWLVCKEECIPGFGTLQFSRPVADGVEWAPPDRKLIDSFLGRVPVKDARVAVEALKIDDGVAKVRFNVSAGALSDFDIFPVDLNFLAPSAPKIQGSEAVFKVVPGGVAPTALGFVVAKGPQAWETAPFVSAKREAAGPPLMLLLAVLGGLILNLMPCVFPVLSIKVFSLVKSGHDHRQLKKDGLSYLAGVILTFAALGAGFLLLRQAGMAVGWGFQLQSPLIVFGLILLFWLMALNLTGLYEMGQGLMSVAGQAGKRGSSFVTGILAVFVAAPCTGPFMGAALGATATLPAVPALAIFVALGIGLALPFVLLTFAPQLLLRLPKPGPWMVTFKEFLAFPLYGTVLWLLWVLFKQIGETAVVAVPALLLLVSFLIWLGHGAKRLRQLLLVIIGISAVVAVAQRVAISEATVAMGDAAGSRWASYDKELIQTARDRGQMVFVDFTAAWCITCQLNKKAVLDTPPIQQLFKKHNVLLVRADWTNQDPLITAALAEFGRASVPLYVFYSKTGEKILPQILTPSMIEELF